MPACRQAANSYSMKKLTLHFLVIALTLVIAAVATGQAADTPAAKPAPKRLLVVTVTKGYRHGSIAAGEKVVADLAQKTGAFRVDFVRTDDDMAQKMTVEALKNYDGVFFLNTTGVLPLPDKAGFLDWIKSGKGFVGTHSATDTFHGENVVDPYIDMIGAEFESHNEAQVDCVVLDPKHPATRHFGPVYHVFDEIYFMKNFSRDKVHMLLAVEKSPGGNDPGFWPISWCKKYGDGRVFYTALGHEDAVWESSDFQLHLLGGIKWALQASRKPGDATPQRVRHYDSQTGMLKATRGNDTPTEPHPPAVDLCRGRISRWRRVNCAVGLLGVIQIHQSPFHRVFSRCLLVLALLGIWPLLRQFGNQILARRGNCQPSKDNGDVWGPDSFSHLRHWLLCCSRCLRRGGIYFSFFGKGVAGDGLAGAAGSAIAVSVLEEILFHAWHDFWRVAKSHGLARRAGAQQFDLCRPSFHRPHRYSALAQ